MPLWLRFAVGIAAGTFTAPGLLIAVAWLAAWAVEAWDRWRLRRHEHRHELTRPTSE